MFSHIKIFAFMVCLLIVAGGIGYHDYHNFNQAYLVVEMKTSVAGVGQVFWDTGHGYNEQDSYALNVSGGEFRKYTFPMSGKEIKSIRFDPVNVSSVVQLREVAVENRQGDVVQRIPLGDFKPVQQIVKMEKRAGILLLQTMENANDPILQIQNSSVNTQVCWKEYLTARRGMLIGGGLIILLVFAGLFYVMRIAQGHQSIKMSDGHVLIKGKIIRRSALIGYSAVIFSLFVLVRWWFYIHAYSVNILFWDQWDFYNPLFNNQDLWEIFSWQHGPHRMGAGLIVTKFIATLSGWNTRGEAFAVGGIVCLAMLAAFFLRIQLGPRLNWADAAIPLIFLAPVQYEIFAGTPFVSYAAMPLLLLVLYCFVWIAWQGLARFTGVLILNILLIYTGFGIFAGFVTPCLFIVEAMKAQRMSDGKSLRIALTGAAVSLLSLVTFFIDYRFMPAVADFHFPVREWWKYPQFMALMSANFCGIKGVNPLSYFAGYLTLLLMLYLVVSRAVRLIRHPVRENNNSRSDAVVAVLTVYTMLFCANAAVGRVSLGLPSAQSSRYITHMIPGFFGIYLWLCALPPGALKKIVLSATLAGLIAASFPLRETDHNTLRWLTDGKKTWRNVYLKTEDVEKATQTANFSIYPAPDQTRLKQKLEYLKEKKLNLYLDVPVPGLSNK